MMHKSPFTAKTSSIAFSWNAIAALAVGGLVYLNSCTPTSLGETQGADKDSPTNSAPTSPKPSAPGCVGQDRFFEAEVWAKVGERMCLKCHQAKGDAAGSELVLSKSSDLHDDTTTEQNCQSFQRVTKTMEGDQSRLLLKVTGGLDHGGGQVLPVDSSGYRLLERYVRRVNGDRAKPTTADVVDDQFKNSEDPFEFIPARLKALKNRAGQTQESTTGMYPHAGYLGMFHYLRRYPTTETNRNRLRARMFYQHFLGIDIMQLAPRVTDAAAVSAKYKVPTMEAADCVVCHKSIDPVAGLFQDFNMEGHLGPRKEGWYADMFESGFEGESMPPEERWRAPQWLGERAARDPRFPVAMTEHVYYILMGRKVLQPPEDIDDPLFAARRRAYQAQRQMIEEVAAKFVASKFNLKVAFKRIALSEFYRADGLAAATAHPQRRMELDDIGIVRLVAPEQLNRKLQAIFGKPWARLDDDLKMLYGGIDSLTVTERNADPSGAMGAIQRIMANDIACEHVARDFKVEPTKRLLFPTTTRLPLRIETTMIRRDFLKLCRLAGLGFASPIRWSSLVEAKEADGESAGYGGPYFVVFNASGGWDTTYMMDPKGVEGINRLYQHDEILTEGVHRFAPIAKHIQQGMSNEDFFKKYGKELLTLNGLDFSVNNHTPGARYMATGKLDSLAYPTFPALVAACRGAEAPLAFLTFGNYSATGNLVPMSRVPYLQSLSLLAMADSIGGQMVQPYHDPFVVDRIERTLEQQFEARVSEARLPRVERSQSTLYSAQVNSKALKRVVPFIPKELAKERLSQQADIALASFKAGVCVSANLSIGQFDSHNNNSGIR